MRATFFAAVIGVLILVVYSFFPDNSLAAVDPGQGGGPTSTPTPIPCSWYPRAACTTLAVCTAEEGTGVKASGCIGTNKPVCCQLPVPTSTPTPTPTSNPQLCYARGGFCYSLPACQAEGGHQNGDNCSGTNICCVVPTVTPTPTRIIYPPGSCADTGGSCAASGVCRAEEANGYAIDGRTVLGCSPNVCCALADLSARCRVARGEYQYSGNYSSGNNSYDNLCYSGYSAIPNFPAGSGSRMCCRPNSGCSSDSGGTNIAGCGCRSYAGNSAGGLSCTSGLSCRVDGGAFDTGLSFIDSTYPFPCANGACTERYVGFITDASSPASSSFTQEWYIYENRDGTWAMKEYLGTGTATSYNGTCAPLPGSSPENNGSGLYTILGQVFIDADLDKVKGSDETQGVGNIKVQRSGSSIPATTNSNGNYYLTDLSGGSTYAINITVPTNYAPTNPNPPIKSVYINNINKSGINFGIAPIYSASGFVFEDKNGNNIKDPGEDYIKGGLSITSTGGTVSPPDQIGEYTVTNLFSGTYSISFIPPQGYLVGTPRPPQFQVTVGTPCSVTNPNQADPPSCSGGNITNLNFPIRTSVGWMQTYGFDVRLDDGYTNNIPANPDYPAYASVEDAP